MKGALADDSVGLLAEDFRPPEGAVQAVPCKEILADRGLDFRGGAQEDEDDLFE
jgi:hypothetical protein